MNKSTMSLLAGGVLPFLALILMGRALSADAPVTGYFPADGQGHGLGYFNVTNEANAVGSYLLEFRRTDGAVPVIASGIIDTATVGTFPAFLGFNFTFTLTLNDANPTSWEIDMQYRVRAYSGAGATGTNLFNTPFLPAAHPSTDVATAPAFTALPVTAGVEPVTVKDARSTASKGKYGYDLFQKFVSAGQSQIDTFDNGFPVALTSVVHGAQTFPRTPTIVSGNQIYFVQCRGNYRNSLGTFIGRYAVSHKSPNTAPILVP